MVRVLITNDDGRPTGADGHSPFVYHLARAVKEQLGWDYRVVVPSSQKSWAGKSYRIDDIVTGTYYYPAGADGTEGEELELPREAKDGEDAPWILIDGTPATCANLALQTLYPEGFFDLVLSGPNFGANASTAYALSSGTIGAAMSASLAGMPAIALSFGMMPGYRPPPSEFLPPAFKASCEIIKNLHEAGWEESGAEIYSINVPLLPSMLQEGGPKVQWTTMAKTGYSRLFKSVTSAQGVDAEAAAEELATNPIRNVKDTRLGVKDEHHSVPLKFAFMPDGLSFRKPAPAGSDTHTLNSGVISVTPVRSGFEPATRPAIVWE
ncbi:tubulin-tyrosine ligase [Pseudohyphozyma bogoriensis]|nr:tubulin-tyrosine ligase [Pseudohyphozyma bogoriensis]